MSKSKENQTQQSGNAVIIVLVALVVVAVGALAYLSGQMAGEKKVGTASEQVAQSEPVSVPAQTAQETPALEVKPGNPVVAKVGGQDILRADVVSYMQNLPPQTRQLPLEQLFPLAQEQVINLSMLALKAKGAKLDSDPEVKRQLDLAKEEIVRNVYLQKTVESKVTDERVKEAYDAYVANFPDVQEAKAAHILVDDEAEAKAIIKSLKEGADFAALAAEKSKDQSSARGGDLGYFLQSDVVAAFGDAVFGAEPGTLIEKPVKTEFGYHVIKVEDKRKRQPVSLEIATPELKARLGQVAIGEIMNEWQKELSVERFDVNGNAVEPAAGDAQ